MPTHTSETKERADSERAYSMRDSADVATQIVPLANIRLWSGNPRKDFDPEALGELADSIASVGLLSPLVVRPIVGNDEVEGACYQIVAGERRFRAALIAHLESVPVIVRDVDDLEALKIAIIENDQRRDVNPMERAHSYQRLVESGMTQEQIAASLKRSQPFVASALGLMRLPESIQRQVSTRALTPSHAELLLRYSDDMDVLGVMAETIRVEKIPVKDLEKCLPSRITDALKKKKLVRVVESYQVPFDVKICEECPFKAMRRDSYGNRVCFRPAHYEELAKVARAAEKVKQEAALVKAKEASGQAEITLRISDLKYNEYTSISDEKNAPDGCSPQCPCRQVALGRDKMPVAICRDPKRLETLRKAQDARELRARQDEARCRQTALAAYADDLEPDDAAPVLAAYLFEKLKTLTMERRAELLRKWGLSWNQLAVFGPQTSMRPQHDALQDLCNLGMQTLLRYLITIRATQELEQWMNYPQGYALSFVPWMESVMVFGPEGETDATTES